MGKRKKAEMAGYSKESERVKAETDLYVPIKTWLQDQGYTVRGEVRGCDVVAVRDGEEWPVVVELKRRFNLSLVLQAVQRLQSTPNVFIAAERTSGRGGFALGEVRRLCLMIGVGLITVKLYKRKPALVEVHCEPGDRPPRAAAAKSPGARTVKLLTEFRERSGDYNPGGGTRRKLVTAYREKALRCADALRAHGPLSPRRLRELTGSEKIASILQNNVYGWFRRVSRGVYELTPGGEAALDEFAEVVAGYRSNNRLHD
ncbi:DUF2161 family putative PD-(D/E)XK-type phosphodiesterase [Paenibacillus alkalitolerans]|uniref:DUF2161 family putative PD-(D/E)XK-type phosphodiesterase n=1 Tax=Paenibacillus alkalitolerans TaxID=2799335 RepID=UPI001F39BD6A|nr:DUF2161 family putative PD-(D/E)XK-type phosphodiesterase [Paenibacillus alkalitolerans]